MTDSVTTSPLNVYLFRRAPSLMFLFDLFGKKQAAPREKECFVAIHCRGLGSCPPLHLLTTNVPDIRKYGSWALQVGDVFYEISEPWNARALRLLDSMDKHSLWRIAHTLDHPGNGSKAWEDGEIDDLKTYVTQKIATTVDHQDESAQSVDDEKPFVLCPSRPGQGTPGEGGDQSLVSLMVSKGATWRELPKSEHWIMKMRDLSIGSREVTGQAKEIYQKLFRWGYDATFYNSQAFVLYLLLSLYLLAGENIKYDNKLYRELWDNSQQKLFHDPSIDFPHVGASLIIFSMWKEIVGDYMSDFPIKWEFDRGSAGRNWVIDAMKLRCRRIVPPAVMKTSLEDGETQSSLFTNITLEQRSYAAHAVSQIRHDLAQNIPLVLNHAIVRQIRTSRAMYRYDNSR